MAESETTNVLSQKLQSFEAIYSEDGNYGGMKNSQSNVTSALQTTENRINSVIDGFGRAGNDAQITLLKKWLNLANSGIDVLRKSVDNDLDSLFYEGNKLHQLIHENIESATKINTKQHYTTQGERQLQAMSNAINNVKLGIRGNMHKDGSLGNYVTFNQGYSFSLEPFNSKNETTGKLTFIQNLGCLVAGGVEGFAKTFEGIGDYLLTGAASVCSVVPALQGLGKNIENFVKIDVSNKAGSGIASVFGISKGEYDKSVAKSLGNITGTIIGYGVIRTVTASFGPAGKILTSMSIAGNVAESSLQKGNSSVKSFLYGTGIGAASYAANEVVERAFSAVYTWASTSSNIVAKGIRYASTSIKDFKTLPSAGAKVVNLVASPLRAVYGVINKTTSLGGKTLGKALGKTLTGKGAGAVQKLVQNGINSVFGAPTSIATTGYANASNLVQNGAAALEKYLGTKI